MLETIPILYNRKRESEDDMFEDYDRDTEKFKANETQQETVGANHNESLVHVTTVPETREITVFVHKTYSWLTIMLKLLHS